MFVFGSAQPDKYDLTGATGSPLFSAVWCLPASQLHTADYIAQNAFSDTCGLTREFYRGIFGGGWYIFSLPTSVYG